MSKETPIGWTDSTTNPTSGCDGCELFKPGERLEESTCYARHLHEQRLALSLPELYSKDFANVKIIPGRLRKASDWADLRGVERPGKPWLSGAPRHIFVGDMGDFLSEGVTDEFLTKELLGAIKSKNGKRHIWQLLTKRPARLADLSEKWGGFPDNVIAMTTVTNQRTAEVRIPELLKVRCATLGISAEPLLGAVNLRRIKYRGGFLDALTGAMVREDGSEGRFSGAGAGRVSWVIAGGESGERSRPMHPAWARSIRDDCASAGAAFFFKQWGHWTPNVPEGKTPGEYVYRFMAVNGEVFSQSDLDSTGSRRIALAEASRKIGNVVGMFPVGKHESGFLLDDRSHFEMPTSARAVA